MRRESAKPVAVSLAALLGALATLLVYQPGVMSVDSVAQYRQATSGAYDYWHPPLMAFTWSVLLKVIPGPLSMLVWHQLLFWGGVALAIMSLRLSALVSAGLVLLIGFFPPVFGLLGVLWKDVGMGAALMLAVGMVLYGNRRGSTALLLGALLPLSYAIAMRYNALPAVIVIVVWIVFELLRRRRSKSVRMVAIASIGLVLAMVLVQALTAALIVRRAPDGRSAGTLQASLIHDLTGVAIRTGNVRFPAYAMIGDPPLTVDLLRELYHRENPNDIVFNDQLRDRMIRTDRGALPELLGTWLGVVVSSPLEYLDHRQSLMASLFGLPYVHYPFHEGIVANEMGLVFERTPLYDTVVGLLHATEGYLFRGWVWLLAAAVLLVTGIVRRRSRSTWIVASGILYVLPYALISTGADFRYLWWLVCATLLAGAVRLDEIKNDSAAEDDPLREPATAL